VDDPRLGSVRISGRLSGGEQASTLLLVVHGLGGSSSAPYAVRAALAAEERGLACLRLNLRGADGSGEDIYHAGLTADVQATLRSPACRRFDRILLLGYSLGGHLVLRYATGGVDSRVTAAAAICPPLDLASTVDCIDRPSRRLYALYLLRALKASYRPVAKRRPELPSYEVARTARRIRQWDELTVVPRFGFEDAADYYRRMSVGPRLGELAVPSLIVAAESDPMVPAAAASGFLADAPGSLRVEWAGRGGHVAFPGGLDLGLGRSVGVEGQVLGWLVRRGGNGAPGTSGGEGVR